MHTEPSVALAALAVICYIIAVVAGGGKSRFPRFDATMCLLHAFLGGVASGWLLALVLRLTVPWLVVSCLVFGLFSLFVAHRIYSQRDEW